MRKSHKYKLGLMARIKHELSDSGSECMALGLTMAYTSLVSLLDQELSSEQTFTILHGIIEDVKGYIDEMGEKDVT